MEKKKLFYKFIKRLLDVLSSLFAIIFFSPLMLIVSVIIICETEGPALFRQKRIGKNNKIFIIYKFRSMTINTPHDVATNLLDKPKEYITRFGRFIRNTSIDELPQLFNILKGDMSVIGPRPVITTETLLIDERAKNGVNTLRPGLSGWAQINGRNKVNSLSKAQLDKYYVDHLSFGFDIKILFLTVIKVLNMRDVSEGNGQK